MVTELLKLVNADGTLAVVLSVDPEPEDDRLIRSGDDPDLILRIIGSDCSSCDTRFQAWRGRAKLEGILERFLKQGYMMVGEDSTLN